MMKLVFTMFLVIIFSFWSLQLYRLWADAKKWGYKNCCLTSSCFTNQSFDLVVTASGKMRTADYTTGKWLELGLGLRLGSGLRLWFRLGFRQHAHAYSLPTVYVPQLRSPHFTRGQWFNGTIRTVGPSYV